MRGSGALAGVVVVILLLLPLFYVLSIGPAIWFHDRGMMGQRVTDVCETIYAPLEWTVHTVPFVERPLEAYISWFRQRQPMPVSAPLPAPPIPPPPPALAPAPIPLAPAASPAVEPDLSEPSVCR